MTSFTHTHFDPVISEELKHTSCSWTTGSDTNTERWRYFYSQREQNRARRARILQQQRGRAQIWNAEISSAASVSCWDSLKWRDGNRTETCGYLSVLISSQTTHLRPENRAQNRAVHPSPTQMREVLHVNMKDENKVKLGLWPNTMKPFTCSTTSGDV